MAAEETEVLIVGGGQAGLAMSEHLSNCGIPHLILERNRIAERWRSERWDSLVANGPAWHDRFPSMPFRNVGADDFAPKDTVVDYFVDYAKMINAPVRCGTEVTSLTKNEGSAKFTAQTAGGDTITARYVVAATGAFQIPIIPTAVPKSAGLAQLHSSSYRNPENLPAGNVLVIGAGSSGVQIAAEIQQSDRQVYLAVGPHDRPPRQYRGRDFVWWLGVLGLWEMSAPPLGAEHVTIAVSGANGGNTVDFRTLAAGGIQLVGRAGSYKNGVIQFGRDLRTNIENGDANFLSILDEADAYIERNGLDLPEEPEARKVLSDPECLTSPITELNLAEAGITSIIWATGFTVDYSWLKVNALDDTGRPKHQRGVSTEPGVYFLGLPWQSRRGSSFIWGVWHDAKYIADQIDIQRSYLSYPASIRGTADEATGSGKSPDADNTPTTTSKLATA